MIAPSSVDDGLAKVEYCSQHDAKAVKWLFRVKLPGAFSGEGEGASSAGRARTATNAPDLAVRSRRVRMKVSPNER
eukprot:g11843.t1